MVLKPPLAPASSRVAKSFPSAKNGSTRQNGMASAVFSFVTVIKSIYNLELKRI